MSCSIAVVGSINLDTLVRVPRLPAPGETILGDDAIVGSGGKGANQAVAAARLGQDVCMVGCIGDDHPGAALLQDLEAEGVDARAVKQISDAPTGIALIAVDPSGENSIVVSPGANARLTAADVDEAAGAVREAGVVLVQLEIPLDAVAAAVSSARGTVILNPAPARPLPAEILERVDVLVPNRAELAVLTGRPVAEAVDAVAEAASGIDGPRDVVVTLGGAGALVVSDGAPSHIPAPEVEVVDATGAGDCFCGALADGMQRGLDLHAAVERAVVAAALSTTRPGTRAALPSADDLRRHLT